MKNAIGFQVMIRDTREEIAHEQERLYATLDAAMRAAATKPGKFVVAAVKPFAGPGWRSPLGRA